jgi:hypothetical protein
MMPIILLLRSNQRTRVRTVFWFLISIWNSNILVPYWCQLKIFQRTRVRTVSWFLICIQKSNKLVPFWCQLKIFQRARVRTVSWFLISIQNSNILVPFWCQLYFFWDPNKGLGSGLCSGFRLVFKILTYWYHFDANYISFGVITKD